MENDIMYSVECKEILLNPVARIGTIVNPVARPENWNTESEATVHEDEIKGLRSVVRRAETAEKQLFCPVERLDANNDELEAIRNYNRFKHIELVDMVNGFRTKIADSECEWLTDFMWAEKWKHGEIVFIEADCGVGKNTYVEYLCKDRRYERVLILANRRANRLQIMERLGIKEESTVKRKNDGSIVVAMESVSVKTYQSLELDSDTWSQELDRYDLIVADEAHYFVTDAQFNARTNISLKKILNTKYATKIFMSATITEVRDYIMEILKKRHEPNLLPGICSYYEMRKSKQNIDIVTCVDFSEILELMINSDEKWIVFVDTKALGEDFMYSLGKRAVFITAESSTSMEMAKVEYENIIAKESFEHQFLIATSVLDNGVNIKDRQVRNIVIANNDRIEMIQMLGRKRCIDRDDTIKLYLLNCNYIEIGKAMAVNYAEQNNWKKISMWLNNEELPPLEFSLNSEVGEQCREQIYFDERKKKFFFNFLGFLSLRIQRKNLKELYETSDIFEKKLEWIFAGKNRPREIYGIAELENRRKNHILEAVEQFLGNEYLTKSENLKLFREKFSVAFWQSFGIDRENAQRADRILSLAKIEFECERHEIPLKISKIINRTNKKKTVTYKIERFELP